MINTTLKTTIVTLMLTTGADALSQEYLCSFQQHGQTDNRNGFEGERIFSADLLDTDDLPCGVVNRKFLKMDSSTSLPNGQINLGNQWFFNYSRWKYCNKDLQSINK